MTCMVKCPECEGGTDYGSYGWFFRHMAKEHGWNEKRAFLYFHSTLKMCSECLHLMPNSLYCNYCGHFIQGSSTTMIGQKRPEEGVV